MLTRNHQSGNCIILWYWYFYCAVIFKMIHNNTRDYLLVFTMKLLVYGFALLLSPPVSVMNDQILVYGLTLFWRSRSWRCLKSHGYRYYPCEWPVSVRAYRRRPKIKPDWKAQLMCPELRGCACKKAAAWTAMFAAGGSMRWLNDWLSAGPVSAEV